MTTEELYEHFRLQVEDTDTTDPLWTDEEVFTYMNSAQRRLALDTDMFLDGSTASVVTAAITTADPWIAINPLITKIKFASLASDNTRVTPITLLEAQRGFVTNDYGVSLSADWQSKTGEIRFVITDMDSAKGRLVGVPTVDDVLNMVVYRYPLEEIIDDSSTLEITEHEYQIAMVDWMKYLAYLKNDADIYDPSLSDKHLASFMGRVGLIKREIRRVRYPVGNTGYGGI